MMHTIGHVEMYLPHSLPMTTANPVPETTRTQDPTTHKKQLEHGFDSDVLTEQLPLKFHSTLRFNPRTNRSQE